MSAPSTAWRERVAPDETERFTRYAEQFAAMQRRKSGQFGNGRALHRKQLLGLRARLEVLDGLPAPARHGLFAVPGRHDALIRLSNGGTDRGSDRRPDVRGFAIKVLGVSGESALGGPAASQDFLLINHPAFAFPDSAQFVGLALAGAEGPKTLIGYLVRRYGLIGGLRQMKRLSRTFGSPFAGFALQTMYSALPIACGPYAARVRLVPDAHGGEPPAPGEWVADLRHRLSTGDLGYALQLQFFVDEATTPIEDASVDWPASAAPWVSVARLTIPRQDPDSAAGQALAERIEAERFDPWSALAAHRPLGDVMRARKVVYYESQKVRGAA